MLEALIDVLPARLIFLELLRKRALAPLQHLLPPVDLLRRPATPESVRARSLAILERQLRHLVRLIDDLLDVSRITTGKLSLQHENVDLAAVLRAAVELAETVARGRGLTLALSPLPARPAPRRRR